MEQRIFRWQPKDWVDQFLHFIIGVALSMLPLLPIALSKIHNPVAIVILIGGGFILSGLFGAAREERQHERWTFDLDLFVWLMGSLVGSTIVTFITLYVLLPK